MATETNTMLADFERIMRDTKKQLEEHADWWDQVKGRGKYKHLGPSPLLEAIKRGWNPPTDAHKHVPPR